MKDWFLLFRPWSYIATLVPFLVAAGFARGNDLDGHWVHWTVGLASGLLFQATVNLLNTWGDEKSGVDDVPGAIRTTPQVHAGSVSMAALLRVALTCAALASLIGVLLCFYREDGEWRFNMPLVVAGFLGLLGATNYTTGVKFKYHGLGVPFVSFLMGPLETFVAIALLDPVFAGETLAFDRPGLPMLFVLTLPIAALVGVVMHGNDMRDMPTDRAAGITTLASRLKPKGALGYYCLCHTLPYGVTFALIIFGWRFSWLPLLVLPLSIRTVRIAANVYRRCPENPPWRGLERASGAILLAYGICYAISLALA